MSTDSFTNSIKQKLTQFIELLNNDETNKGKSYYFYYSCLLLNKKNTFLEYSENTSISNVKTLEIAQVQTSDPAITISLSLEVAL
jgi:ribonucleotide reductase beta subunit family protein with ferritin-like domain